MEKVDLVKEFQITVSNGDKASEVLGDGTDQAFHSMFERGVFDNVPVFGYFVKACNVLSDIQAYRFCKKIYKFLFFTQNYDRAKLDAFWREYAFENKENSYELMLSVLDNVDNINKVDIMAYLLKAKLDGEITIEDFIRLTAALNVVPYIDLNKLPDYLKSKEVGKETYMLFAAGLVYESVTNREGPSQYQLNDNGILFVKYGLRQSVEGYKREATRILGMLTAVPVTDFKQIFNKGNGK